MEIPDVIKPVPALMVNRTQGNIGWFRDEIAMGDHGELCWREVAIVFWNGEKQASGTIARFNLN
jgi:hypothetical protein